MKILETEDGPEEPLAEVHAERFRRETRMCAGLHHPHIVRLIDTGEADGWLYTVFEFVPGRPLSEVLRDEGAFSVDEAVHLMGQVLDAVGHAHGQGVIHRDLTPANVMVSDSGLQRNALVLDFGISAFADRRHSEELTRLTATHEAIGTPSYAAPEQLRGEDPTAGTDLYSWGLVLLECLTGEKPVRGESLQEQLAQQLGPDPIEIPDAVRALPVARVLGRALAKDREDRAKSAEELMDLLRAAGSPFLPRAPSLADRTEDGPSVLQPVTALSVRATWPGGAGDESVFGRRIREFQRHADEIVRVHGGRSVAALGARVVALFGYPEPTEQAARAALEAAVAIRDGALVDDRALVFRGGVSSGELRAPANDDSFEPTASRVVDDAMALEARADASEILACEETRHRLRGRAPLERVSDDEPPAFRLTAGSDALRSSLSTPTPMIGRAAELERLVSAWRSARAGRPQSLLVVGEPGIGKSRLVHELRRELQETRWVVCRCTPESEHSPLRPVVEWLSIRTRELPLDALLSELGLDVSALHPLLAELLGQPYHPDHPPVELPPRRRRERVMEALLELFFAEARREPFVLCVEDLHWADPTTRELLHELVRRVRAADVFESRAELPVLVLFTARPTFEPPWSLSDVPLVQLSRLSRNEAEELARALSLRGARFAEKEIGPLVERAGGVPFFLEEMARMARDPKARSAAIPATLRDLLEARIASLRTDVRRTAQQAACVGREFEFRLLAAVAARDEDGLRDDLADLGHHGIIARRAGLGDERYVFHHALLGDSARESMTPTQRRATHLEIASRLQGAPFEQVATQQPERLAHHFEEGGAIDRAIEFRQRAGFSAAARSAHPESIHHYERALEMLLTFPEGPERDHAERSLLILIGSAYMTTQGYAAEPVQRSFERALELCNRYEEAPRLFSALNGLWAYHLVRGDAAHTPGLVVRMREVAESSGSERRLLFGHHAEGTTAFYAGQLEQARSALREATARYERASAEPSEGPAWHRHAGTAPMYLGWCLHLLGSPEEALAWKTRGLELAEQLRDVDAHVEAMTYGVALHYDRREPEAVLELSNRIVPLAEEYGLDFWLSVAKGTRGWARCHTGDPSGGFAEIDAGLELFHRSGALLPLVYRACYVAEAYLLAGRSKEGLAALDDAFERAPNRLDRFYDAEAHRLRGELLALAGDEARAETEFARSARIAAAQGARLFVLRTAASRVRLRRGTAGLDESLAELRAAHDAFQGGRDLPDLVEARALLEG